MIDRRSAYFNKKYCSNCGDYKSIEYTKCNSCGQKLRYRPSIKEVARY